MAFLRHEYKGFRVSPCDWSLQQLGVAVTLYTCDISGSHSGEYEDRLFWDVAPCSLVEVYRRFRVACSSIIRAHFCLKVTRPGYLLTYFLFHLCLLLILLLPNFFFFYLSSTSHSSRFVTYCIPIRGQTQYPDANNTS
jgi:hypothetical protein